MSKPKIAARVPAVLDLEPGQYWWCSCGHSSEEPFCDGSHKGTTFTPQQLVVTEQKKVALCRCKYTDKPPQCDGNHRNLADE